MSKFYAVRKGKNPGVYRTWDECKDQVHKFSGAIYKSFKTLKEAQVFMSNSVLPRVVKKVPMTYTNAKVKSNIKVTTQTTTKLISLLNKAPNNLRRLIITKDTKDKEYKNDGFEQLIKCSIEAPDKPNTSALSIILNNISKVSGELFTSTYIEIVDKILIRNKKRNSITTKDINMLQPWLKSERCTLLSNLKCTLSLSILSDNLGYYDFSKLTEGYRGYKL